VQDIEQEQRVELSLRKLEQVARFEVRSVTARSPGDVDLAGVRVEAIELPAPAQFLQE